MSDAAANASEGEMTSREVVYIQTQGRIRDGAPRKCWSAILLDSPI